MLDVLVDRLGVGFPGALVAAAVLFGAGTAVACLRLKPLRPWALGGPHRQRPPRVERAYRVRLGLMAGWLLFVAAVLVTSSDDYELGLGVGLLGGPATVIGARLLLERSRVGLGRQPHDPDWDPAPPEPPHPSERLG